MIACDNSGLPIEWFYFECVGLVDVPSGKWLRTECAVYNNIFSYHCSEMLCCNVKIHILAKFNNPQQVLFRCIKRKLLPY